MKIVFNGYFYKNEKLKVTQAVKIFSENFKISRNYHFTVHSLNESESKKLKEDAEKLLTEHNKKYKQTLFKIKKINEDAIYESLISFKRAGASAMITYFAEEIAQKLR